MALNNPIYYWEPIYTLKEVKAINKKLKKDFLHVDTTSLAAQGVVKTSKVDAVLWKDAKKYLHKFNSHVRFRNSIAFGFHLFPENYYNWFFFNKYNAEVSGEYGWHMDAHNYPPSDIKLTALLNLSEAPYEGGKLEIRGSTLTNVPELDSPGNMVIFPSFFLHRVTPVTQGVRNSLAFLISGKRWT